MTMHLPRRAIDQHDIKPRLALLLQIDEDMPPQPLLAAAFEPRVNAVPVAVTFRQIAPRAAHAQHLKYRAKHLLVAAPGRSPVPDITAFDQR